MDKKLPGIFANKITKKLNNNKSVYYSKEDNDGNTVRKTEKTKKEKNIISTNNNIRQKINEIFSGVDFVYKSDVKITFEDGTVVNKRIIGYNNTSIITYDDELIPINKIVDIEKI